MVRGLAGKTTQPNVRAAKVQAWLIQYDSNTIVYPGLSPRISLHGTAAPGAVLPMPFGHPRTVIFHGSDRHLSVGRLSMD